MAENILPIIDHDSNQRSTLLMCGVTEVFAQEGRAKIATDTRRRRPPRLISQTGRRGCLGQAERYTKPQERQAMPQTRTTQPEQIRPGEKLEPPKPGPEWNLAIPHYYYINRSTKLDWVDVFF